MPTGRLGKVHRTESPVAQPQSAATNSIQDESRDLLQSASIAPDCQRNQNPQQPHGPRLLDPGVLHLNPQFDVARVAFSDVAREGLLLRRIGNYSADRVRVVSLGEWL